MSNREVLKQIEILLQCDEQIEFVREVLQRAEISEPLQVEITDRIDRIEQRKADPNLYLAVIGEFSSGKSTFINALLQDDLLKTSALVTTAAATKIRYGDCLQVEAHFSGAHVGMVSTQPNSQIVHPPWLSSSQAVDIKEFIQIVSSDEEIARDAIEITIDHPASFLSNGVMIIDTPGTNADNSQHGDITRRVIESRADLSIVIIPATIPLSQTLADFLNHSLKPYLHRCIFVVTRIDEIRPQEISKVLRNLRTRIVQQLDISAPILYACSAQVALDMLNGTEVVADKLQVWQERFTKLEEIIIDRLNRERIINIAESLLRLLDRLFEQLEISLNLKWQQYATRQNEISRQTIPNLPEFTVEQYAICEMELKKSIAVYLSAITSCVDYHRKHTTEKIRTILFSATTEDALNAVIQTQVEQILQADCQQIEIELKPFTTKLAAAAINVGKIFDRKFAQAYHRLQSIRGEVESSMSNDYSWRSPSSNVASSARSTIEKFDLTQDLKMGAGAIAGAVVGSILLPGLGGFVGIAVGSWVSNLFALSLDKRKQALWEQLAPSLKLHFDPIETQIQADANTYTHSLETALKQRIDLYIKKYQAIVENILAEQIGELGSLNQLQQSVRSDLTEIERRRKYLFDRQTKFAKIDI